MKALNIFGMRKRIVLDHSKNSYTFMQAISEKELDSIKKEKQFKGQAGFKLGDRFISPDDVILFGDIDLTKQSDINVLKKSEKKIWDCYNNHWYYTKVDYKNGIVPFDENRGSYLQSQTFNLITWIKYNLVWLGNPKNIIVFKLPEAFAKKQIMNLIK